MGSIYHLVKRPSHPTPENAGKKISPDEGTIICMMKLNAPQKMEGTTLTIDTLEQKVNKISTAKKVEFCKAMKPFGNRCFLVKMCILVTYKST